MASSVMFRETQTLQILLCQYQEALKLPVSQRILRISVLLNTSQLKDLKYLYPKVVEDAFGYPNKLDWELLSSHKCYYPREFEALHNFFSPTGPLLQLAFSLLADRHAKFEFPISSLPHPSASCLKDGTIPPLYVNKYQDSTSHGVRSQMLLLNAFDFYIFHFGYFITRPSMKNYDGVVNQAQTLYAQLLEDYLYYFLPTNGRPSPLPMAVALPNSPYNTPTQSMSADLHSPSHWVSPKSPSSSFLNKIPSSLSLLKESSFLALSSPSSPQVGQNATFPSMTSVWHSESFLMILMDMYLNHVLLDQPNSTLGLFTERFVPNHYHVWMVRTIIKHLHAFSSSVLLANHAIKRSPVLVDSLAELKSAVPQIIHRHLYEFLNMAFNRWPLDASFRVLLETWLSYIQPWRYSLEGVEKEYKDFPFSVKWQKFVTENYFFYSTLFSHAIKRFLRMDMSCPQNAYMLYRVSKVFAQKDLDIMIKEAERNQADTVPKSPSFSLMQNPCMSRLHSTSPQSQTSFLRPHVTESNVPTIVSIFSAPVRSQAIKLLNEVASARERMAPQVTQQNQSWSFSQLFTSVNSDCSIDEQTVDFRKFDTHLKEATQNLCQLLGISEPTSPDQRSQTFDAELPLEQSLSGPNFVRWLNLMSNRKPHFQCEGNPDLQPVRTYESEILVKMFAEISEVLNLKYGAKFRELYESNNLLGKISRQLLFPPAEYYHITKARNMLSVTREKVLLAPRVCLRPFGNKHRIIIFLLYLFIMYYFFDRHPLAAMFFVFVFVACLIFSRALLGYNAVIRRD